MNHEREHSHAERSPDAARAELEPAPTRATRSSQLTAPAQPVASGLIQRKARDAAGVAGHADEALAAASGRTGSPLPDALKQTFEASLGADLSGVRVHTGGESAVAAHAVGARAYTLGQDIHFGAGHYDPSSRGGQHLLAHEVAHTVQQRGATPSFQGKLEVSSPADALELEADAAADHMLAGQAAAVTSGAGLQRTVMRDVLPTEQQMDQSALRAAAARETEIREHPPAVTTIDISGSASQARSLINDIHSYDAHMNEGVSDGTEGCVTRAQYTANHQAVDALQHFVDATGDQGSTLGQFQAHAERLFSDYARIQGQVAGFNASAQGGGAITGSMHGGQVADAVITGASGGTVEELQGAFRSANSGGNAAVAAHFTAYQRTLTDLQRVSGEVAVSESNASAKEARARSAHNALISAVASQQATGLESQIAGLRAAAAAMKEKIDLAAGMVKSLVKLGGTALSGGTVGAADAANEGTAAAFSIAGYLATHQYDDQIAQLNAQLRPIAAQRDTSAIASARDNALGAKREWETAGQEYVNKIHEQQRLRTELNTHLRNLGQAADRSAGGNSFTIITQLLSACQQYLAQSRTTRAIGENEELRNAETTGAAAGVNAPRASGGREPLTYYRPYQFWTQGAIRWACTQMTAYLYHDARDAGSRTIRQTLQMLEEKEHDVESCANHLGQVFH